MTYSIAIQIRQGFQLVGRKIDEKVSAYLNLGKILLLHPSTKDADDE